jgi:ligand-binding sensor domain-containing protein
MKKLLWWCIFWRLACPLLAQNPYLQQQNLPTQTIYDMLVDKQGRIYLGTDKGLFRFNGKTATLIPFADAKQADITMLREDAQGRIWGLNFAKQIFYLNKDTLRTFPFPAHEPQGALINFDFTKKQIWIATNSTVYAYSLHDFKPLLSQQGTHHFTDLVCFQNHALLHSFGKIYTFDAQGAYTTAPTNLKGEARFLKHQNKLYCLLRKESERIYVSWDSPTQPFVEKTSDLPAHLHLYHAVVTPQQAWLCTRTGAYKFSPTSGKTALVFPEKNITDIAQDFQGNHWISTLNEGLWFCPDLQNVYYPLPTQKQFALADIQTLFAKGEKLYAGLSNGYIAQTTQAQTTQWEEVGKFAEAEVRRVNFHPARPLIATSQGVFDLQGNIHIPFKGIALKDAHFYVVGKQEFLLITHSFGFYWIDLLSSVETARQKLMGCDLDIIHSRAFRSTTYTKFMPQRTYCAVANWAHQKFWVGTDSGLYEYDSTGKATVLHHAGKPIIARQLVLDAQARLWVSTFQQGVFVIEKQRVVAHFKAGKGLKSNFIRKIVLQDNKLWIGTDAEIGYFDTQNFEFQEVLAQMGRDFCPTEKGIWVALPRGVVFMVGKQARILPKPHLLPVRRVGKATFVAEALHYKNPTEVALHYRLKGKTWRVIKEPQTLLDYSELPQGHYDIEIFAQDETTKARSKTQHIHFRVPPRWWETWWWYVLVWAGVSALIFGLTYAFFERKRKKQLLKEQLWISQLKALRAQMNPHFLYNILNTVQGLVYSNRKTEAGELLGNFSDLMRKSLQASENAYISLREELEMLSLYLLLEKARFDDSFEYELAYENIREYQHLKIPSMLIQPFVENALKHGLLHKKGAKHLRVCFDIQEETTHQTLIVGIIDNGIGRQASAEINKRHKNKSTGFATRATAQRIELLNLDKKNHITWRIHDHLNERKEPQGTEVEIIIHVPIH